MNDVNVVVPLTPSQPISRCYIDFRCGNCDGKAYFYQGGWIGKFKKSQDDPDWRICDMCKGTGKLQAEVSVKWLPYGDVITKPDDDL